MIKIKGYVLFTMITYSMLIPGLARTHPKKERRTSSSRGLAVPGSRAAIENR